MKNIIAKLTEISKEDSSLGMLADYLLKYEGDIGDLTSTKLSEELFISIATATRLSSRMELDGFSHLKIQLAQARSNPYLPCFEDQMFNFYFEQMTSILSNTLGCVNREQIDMIARELDSSSKINFFAVGSSNIAVRYLGQKLTKINKTVTHHPDSHMQHVEAMHSNSTIVGFGVSYSGLTAEIIGNLQTTKRHGGTTILITSNQNVNYNFVDYTIKVPKTENDRNNDSISKRFTSVITLDLIYLALLEANPQYNQKLKLES